MEEQQQNKQTTELIAEIALGELRLGSSSNSIGELCSIAVGLLENKAVKEYLEVIRIKKLNGVPNYTQ